MAGPAPGWQRKNVKRNYSILRQAPSGEEADRPRTAKRGVAMGLDARAARRNHVITSSSPLSLAGVPAALRCAVLCCTVLCCLGLAAGAYNYMRR